MTRGWLTAQLPRAMAADPLLAGLVSVAEEIAGTLRADVDALEQHLDVATASAPMLRYLASWVEADLDPGVSVDRQREALRATGPLLGWRGTRRGLEDLLEALTGARPHVTDSGGAFAGAEPRPAPDLRVVVELDDLGELTEQQVRAVIAREVPAGSQVEMRLPAGARSAQQGTLRSDRR